MRRALYRRLAAICMGWLLLGLLSDHGKVARADEQICFEQTRICISGLIKDYWERNGGLPVFGYARSELRDELNVDTGTFYKTQWFERARMELHPENAPPYDVLLGRLGTGLLEAKGHNWQQLPQGDPGLPHYFPETGHAIAQIFRDYWSSHGLEFDGREGSSFGESLALFGMPLSEPAMEDNGSGHTVLTQWFERARFEHHPNNPDPYKVLLGRLGAELMSLAPCCASIAFSSDRDDPSGEIYVMSTNRTLLKRLTNSPGSDTQPAWSPGGSAIAFVSDRDGDPEIYVMNADGSNVRQLTHNDAREAKPAWSPDGRQIAFESDRDRSLSTFDLYVMQSDGSQQRRLTDDPANDSCPAWADNTRIGFSRGDTSYTIGADGGGLTVLLEGGRCPRWTPISRNRIAVTIVEGDKSYIGVAERDGSGLTRLTESGADRDPSWASDNRHIAFSSRRKRPAAPATP